MKKYKRVVAAAVVLLAIVGLAPAKDGKKDKAQPKSALDQSIEALSRSQESERQATQAPGSLWTASARYMDLAADLRGRRVGDIITIQVQERASAVSTGTVKTARTSSVASNISSFAGITRATGPLANLAKAGTATSIDGQGTTTRDTTLTATVSALVTQVLPNGNLVIQGTKNVGVNAENQTIIVRGMVRPIDLDTTNSVPSDRIAQMEIQVNGKGIVADNIKRPFILYRLILGLLPF
jgi:flagellar L-ring protein precursor FlgH